VIFKKKIIELIAKTKLDKPAKEKKSFLKFFSKIGNYFKGSWTELRQVRWPNRKATWGLTGAVILFTAFFTLLIILLDAGFKSLFNIIIK
jgi:preprotein translocase subunit SecE